MLCSRTDFKTYFRPKRFEECQARMTRDFANESSLFVEVHSLKIRLILGEDFVGLRDNPDLYNRCK
jgi:hypothetical protein